MGNERVEGMKKRENNNKGLTLIELLVALSIVSVVVTLAFGFIIHTVRIYNRGGNDSLVQNDAQLTMAQLESLVVNANMGIGLNPDASPQTDKELYLYYRDYAETEYDSSADKEQESVKPYEALHIYVDPNKGLSFCTRECTYGTDPVTGKPKVNMTADKAADKTQVLSQYVNDFTVDLSKLESKSEMTVTMKFAYRDKSYETTNTIKLRNKIVGMSDSDEAGDYFKVLNDTDQSNQILGIHMDTKPASNPPLAPGSVPTASAWTGTTFAVPFQVTYDYLDGTTGSGQTVWTLAEGVSSDIKINRMTGMITIPADYTGGDFDIYATALSVVNKVNRGDGTDKDEDDNDIINSNNRAKGTIQVKAISDPVLSEFIEDGTPTTKKATLSFSTKHLDTTDVQMIHPQFVDGLELRPQISTGTMGVDGTLSYDVTVQRPINYRQTTPFTLTVSCVVNGKTLTATGMVTFTATGSEDIFNGVTIYICDSQGVTKALTENEVLSNLSRGDRAVFTMSAKYTGTDGSVKDSALTVQEWKLRCESGESSGVNIYQTSDGYSVSYNVADYTKPVSIGLVYDYLNEDGTWDENHHITLQFPPVVLTSNVNSLNQSMFPITRGRTQIISFNQPEGVLNASLYALDRGDSSKIRVSISGFSASITASASMSAAETVTFGLQKGNAALDGVSNAIKFYPGSANTRTLNGGSLSGTNGAYDVYIPPVSDLTKYDSSKTLTESVPFTLYTADGDRMVYFDYSNNNAKNVDKNGSKRQYWVEYEHNGVTKTFFYHAASRQWRLNEN